MRSPRPSLHPPERVPGLATWRRDTGRGNRAPTVTPLTIVLPALLCQAQSGGTIFDMTTIQVNVPDELA